MRQVAPAVKILYPKSDPNQKLEKLLQNILSLLFLVGGRGHVGLQMARCQGRETNCP